MAIQGVWTIVVELKTVAPVAAAAAALEGNDGSGAQELCFLGGSIFTTLATVGFGQFQVWFGPLLHFACKCLTPPFIYGR